MFKHILLATDGSSASEKAVAQALELAKSLNAKVLGVTSTELWSALDVSGPDGRERITKYEAAAKKSADKILSNLSAAAERAGVACVTLHVPDASPAVAIVETAKREGCDLIVMGSHGRRGIDRLLLGSQAQRVVTNAACPVLVCR
ncbi:MAG: universal stress protein [Hyphomicrobiales bacterium]|nr:MAG: universal stress protein [Hyphomicrobiales bacterium]